MNHDATLTKDKLHTCNGNLMAFAAWLRNTRGTGVIEACHIAQYLERAIITSVVAYHPMKLM